MKYFFALGHQPKLSLAEIKSVLSSLTDFVVKSISSEICIIEIKEKIDLNLIQKRLGGTIKIGKIIQESEGSKILFSTILDTVNKIYSNLNNSKVYFGFSLYNLTTKILRL